MKRILALILMFIFFITPSTFAADGKVYENQQYKFRITLPTHWKTDNTSNAIFNASSTDTVPSLSISAIPIKIPPNITNFTLTPELKDKAVTQFIATALKSHPNMVVKEKSMISINNDDVIRVVSVEDFIYTIHYFIFSKDSVFIGLAGGLLNNLDIDKKLLDQTISTFTFID